MKKLFFTLCVMMLITKSYGQNNDEGLKFEDYNTTTYTLLNLLIDAGKNKAHEKVNLYLNTLEQLKTQYTMKDKHIQRINKFKADNLSNILPFRIDLNGISLISPGGFSHQEVPTIMREFNKFLALREQGFNTENFESMITLNKLKSTPTLKFKNLPKLEQLNIEKLKEQLKVIEKN